MRSTPLFAALLLVLAACERSPRAGLPPAADSAGPAGDTVAPASAETPFTPPADTVVARWAARIPDGLLVRQGACPFECCVYRAWTSATDVPLRGEPRHRAPVVGSLPAEEPFQADSGFVRVTGVMLVIPHDTVSGYGPGDTLLVLDYIGEGYYSLWDGSAVREVPGFWGAESERRIAETLGRWEREWWTHATGTDGRAGWFSPDSMPDLDGVDACG